MESGIFINTLATITKLKNTTNMSIKKYQHRDLVNTTDEFGGRTFVISSVAEHGYCAIAIDNKKKYNLRDFQISSKIGVLPDNSDLLVEVEYDHETGRQYCIQQSREFPAESVKWLALANLKKNDKLCLVHRRNIFHDAVFVSINFKKPLYPIRAIIKGLTFDFRLDAMILEN